MVVGEGTRLTRLFLLGKAVYSVFSRGSGYFWLPLTISFFRGAA